MKNEIFMTQYDTKVLVNDIYVRDDKKRNKLFTEKRFIRKNFSTIFF